MFCPVDSPPPLPCLSLTTQACQLTSPALMSPRAASCSRKLLSGKDTSALGVQLWLPVGSGTTRQAGSDWRRRAAGTAASRALTRALEQKESRALAVQEVSRLCKDKHTRPNLFLFFFVGDTLRSCFFFPVFFCFT